MSGSSSVPGLRRARAQVLTRSGHSHGSVLPGAVPASKAGAVDLCSHVSYVTDD